MSTYNLEFGLVQWLMGLLTCRSQSVRVNRVLSHKKMSSTGSPQGCVLSSLLYIVYINDCRSHHPDRHLLKFADDTVLISLLQDGEDSQGPIVSDFVE